MFVSDISVNLEIQLLVELKICYFYFCSGMNSVHSVPEFSHANKTHILVAFLQNYMSNTVLVVSVTSLYIMIFCK